MFGISSTELFMIAIFAFIIFGPDKIPEIAKTVSKAIAMFKRTQEDMERTIKAEMSAFDPTAENSIFASTTAVVSPGGPKPAADSPLSPDKSSSNGAPTQSQAASLYGIADEEEEDEE